ncbi:hypothetical protein SynRS9907_01171 [Synechococcus sp. RS9907]|nr:hypothetical protein SynRS9907_01171 [Synechococcus sp. RS9907]
MRPFEGRFFLINSAVAQSISLGNAPSAALVKSWLEVQSPSRKKSLIPKLSEKWCAKSREIPY